MADPFSRFSVGGSPLDGIHAEAEQHSRWIQAYRHNILLPDVTLVSRKEPIGDILVIGEDGEILTPERRRQLAEERRVQNGDYRTSEYKSMGEREKWGESAVKCRPPCLRIVTPKEFDEQEIQETIAESAAIDEAIALERSFNERNKHV